MDNFSPVKIAKMSKEEIMDTLKRSYTDSKPINDSLVDISIRIQTLTAEIYRRSIIRQLPDIPFTRRRTVMKLNCSVHPNTGMPQIAQRLVQLNSEGIKVIEVTYDENTGDFYFLTEPEFKIETAKPESN